MTPMDRDDRFLQLMHRLRHRFEDDSLLETALTHRSYANEAPQRDVEDNERLEFLGDAVIDLYVSAKLYDRRPGWREGELSQARASLVNASALAEVARDLGLGELLRLGRGESKTGGQSKDSILCGTLEAVYGALFIDAGIGACFTALDAMFAERLGSVATLPTVRADAKTELQERLAANSLPPPRYAVCAEHGPPHLRTFTVAVCQGERTLAVGSGSNKKLAEQRAASAALAHIRRMEAGTG